MAVQLVLAAVLFSSTVSARAVDGIEISADEVQRRDGLLAAFNTHFHPERADSATHLDSHAHERGTCLTGMVKDFKESWHLFTASERAEITRSLAPFKADLLDPLVPAGLAAMGAGGPPPPGSCWGDQKDNTIETEHFSVQWDDGTVSESDAEDFAESLEYSYGVEIDELEWREPEGLPTYKILAMIENMGGGGGAYTTVDYCGGQTLPYIVASSGSFSAGSWYKTMACHELHHAIQFGYGYSHEFWYWEASATWVEDLVYPDLNDWMNAIYVYSLVPYMGMNASRTGGGGDEYLFYHTYAMGIWGMFLDQHVGGNELVRDTWEVSRTTSCQYCLWMPDAVDRTGEDFYELYTQFIANNAVMDYRDRLWMQTPTLSDQVSTLPSSGESDYQDRPQSLGQNFIRFDASLGGSGKALEVTFDGENTPDLWVAILMRGEDEVEEIVEFELNENMWGVATIDFPGDSDVHLIVSPVDEDAQGYSYDWNSADDFDYEWSAQLVDSTTEEDPDDTSEGDDDPGPVADGDEGGEVIGRKGSGCACAASGTGQAGWLALILGLVPVLRRRS
jgi:MYXO-CTERM domain-containing protein